MSLQIYMVHEPGQSQISTPHIKCISTIIDVTQAISGGKHGRLAMLTSKMVASTLWLCHN